MSSVHKLVERIAEDDMTLSARECVAMVKQLIMTRKGDVIDDNLATERARNIATSLVGYTIV